MDNERDNGRWKSGFAFSRGSAVLLVDEDPAKLHLYSVMLRELGCRVQTCGSFQQGVELLDSKAFGLVIVSQGSCHFEGRVVLARANEINRNLPVLVLARFLEMSCYLEAMQLGAVDYLAEPITANELARAVETHLPWRPGVREPVLGVSRRGRGARLSA